MNVPKIKQTPETVAALMADNRERTVNDVAMRLKMSPDSARAILSGLTREGVLASEEIAMGAAKARVWRKA
jgi:predicted ArsR family transcriptional regulator